MTQTFPSASGLLFHRLQSLRCVDPDQPIALPPLGLQQNRHHVGRRHHPTSAGQLQHTRASWLSLVLGRMHLHCHYLPLFQGLPQANQPSRLLRFHGQCIHKHCNHHGQNSSRDKALQRCPLPVPSLPDSDVSNCLNFENYLTDFS